MNFSDIFGQTNRLRKQIIELLSAAKKYWSFLMKIFHVTPKRYFGFNILLPWQMNLKI